VAAQLSSLQRTTVEHLNFTAGSNCYGVAGREPWGGGYSNAAFLSRRFQQTLSSSSSTIYSSVSSLKSGFRCDKI
jgi:hypothetical protein